jgi:hypothetical protein
MPVAWHANAEESTDKIMVDGGAIASTACRSGFGGDAEPGKDMEELTSSDRFRLEN